MSNDTSEEKETKEATQNQDHPPVIFERDVISWEKITRPMFHELYGAPGPMTCPTIDAINREPRELKHLNETHMTIAYDPDNLVGKALSDAVHDINIRYVTNVYLFPLGVQSYVVNSEVKMKGYLSGFQPSAETGHGDPTAEITITPIGE